MGSNSELGANTFEVSFSVVEETAISYDQPETGGTADLSEGTAETAGETVSDPSEPAVSETGGDDAGTVSSAAAEEDAVVFGGVVYETSAAAAPAELSVTISSDEAFWQDILDQQQSGTSDGTGLVDGTGLFDGADVATASADGVTIVVTNSDELKTAMRTATGGETILLAPSDDKYTVNIWKKTMGDAKEQVTIRSLDPEDPAVIDQIMLTRMSDLKFEDLVFSGDPRDSHNNQDLILAGCDRVEITDCTFSGRAEGFGMPGDDFVSALYVSGCTDVSISGTEFENYLRAITHRNNTNLSITGNDFHDIQEDGIRGGGVDGLTISGNAFHDWLGILNGWLHGDFIQLWSAGTDRRTENVVISDNIFTGTEERTAAQVIFARNDQIDMFGGDPEEFMFRNWTVENNVIDVPSSASIKLALIEDSLIANNTILQNGAVQLSNSTNVEVLNNIFSKLQTNGTAEGLVERGNLALQDDDPALADYFKLYFSNVDAFRETGDISQLTLREGVASEDGSVPGADLFGMAEGPLHLVIERTEFNFGSDAGTVGFHLRAFDDEGREVGLGPVDVTWTMGDGTVLTGESILHSYGSRGAFEVTATVSYLGFDLASSDYALDVPELQLFKLGLDDAGQVFDQSQSGGVLDGTPAILADEELGASVIRIEQGQAFRIDPGMSMAGLPEMSMEMWLQRDSADADAGKIVSKSGYFQLRLRGDGDLHFRITNPETGKSQDIFIEDHGLDNADWHQIAVTMDAGDAARLYIDGVLKAEAAIDWAAPASDDSFMFGSNNTATLASEMAAFEVSGSAWSPEEVAARYADHMASGSYDVLSVAERAELARAQYGTDLYKMELSDSMVFDMSGAEGVLDGQAQVIADEDYDMDVIQLDQQHVFRVDPGASMAGQPEMSVEMWLQRDAADADAGKIVSKSDAFQLRLRGDGQLHFKVIDPETGKATDVFVKDHGLDDADWHQIVVTMDAGDAARLYVDGALLGQVETDWAAAATDDPFMFGSNNTATLAAQISDFGVTDQSWSQEQIQDRYLAHLAELDSLVLA